MMHLNELYGYIFEIYVTILTIFITKYFYGILSKTHVKKTKKKYKNFTQKLFSKRGEEI